MGKQKSIVGWVEGGRGYVDACLCTGDVSGDLQCVEIPGGRIPQELFLFGGVKKLSSIGMQVQFCSYKKFYQAAKVQMA